MGKASVCQPLANEEDSEKRNNHQSGKEGRPRKGVTQMLQWCILWPGDRSCHSCSSWPPSPCCTARPHDRSRHTGNTWPCHIVSGCVRTPRRSSTSARCRGHSRVPHDQLCHSYSNTALSPFWVPYSLWKYGHSCGNCSMLYLKQKKIINKLCRRSTNCTKCNDTKISRYDNIAIFKYWEKFKCCAF